MGASAGRYGGGGGSADAAATSGNTTAAGVNANGRHRLLAVAGVAALVVLVVAASQQAVVNGTLLRLTGSGVAIHAGDAAWLRAGSPPGALTGGRVRRVSYGEPHRYGPFGYFTELERVCVSRDPTNEHAITLAGGGDAAASVAALEPFYPYGNVVGKGVPSVLGFHVRRIDVAPAPLAVPPACWVPGATLAYENTVGVPGHIAHMAENVVKYLPIAAAMAATGRGAVDRVWVWHLPAPFPKLDYESSLLHALLTPNASGPPPIYLAGVAGAGCDRLCFERLYWPEMASRYMASPAHADEVREAVWAYCGVSAPARRAKPTLMYMPRYNGRREILNYPALLARAAARHGFTPLPPPANATTLCGQVALMATVDVLVTSHGAQLTNIMFMRRGSVVIETTNAGFYFPVFKPLAAASGHAYLEYDNVFPNTLETPSDAKDTNLCLDLDDFDPFLAAAAAALVDPAAAAAHPCMVPTRCAATPAVGDNTATCMPDNNEAFPSRCMPASYTPPTPAVRAARPRAAACDFAAERASLDFAAFAAKWAPVPVH